MDNFDLKKYLVEAKLTSASKNIQAQEIVDKIIAGDLKDLANTPNDPDLAKLVAQLLEKPENKAAVEKLKPIVNKIQEASFAKSLLGGIIGAALLMGGTQLGKNIADNPNYFSDTTTVKSVAFQDASEEAMDSIVEKYADKLNAAVQDGLGMNATDLPDYVESRRVDNNTGGNFVEQLKFVKNNAHNFEFSVMKKLEMDLGRKLNAKEKDNLLSKINSNPSFKAVNKVISDTESQWSYWEE